LAAVDGDSVRPAAFGPLRISGGSHVPDQTWPTVRQPSSVAVDGATGRLFIAGRADSQLELIDPGTPGTPPPH